MSDLFTRLAERALEERGSLIVPVPDPGTGHRDVDPDGFDESTAPAPVGGPVPPPPAAVPPAERSTAVLGPPGPTGAPGIDGRSTAGRIRLVPVPPTVPPALPVVAPDPTTPAQRAAPDHTASTRNPGPASWPSVDVEPSDRARPRGRLGPITGGLRYAPRTEPPSLAPRHRADAPAVEVTVGRIDITVRAPAPARPAQTARRSPDPTPALTLDEYLRRRETAP